MLQASDYKRRKKGGRKRICLFCLIPLNSQFSFSTSQPADEASPLNEWLFSLFVVLNDPPLISSHLIPTARLLLMERGGSTARHSTSQNAQQHKTHTHKIVYYHRGPSARASGESLLSSFILSVFLLPAASSLPAMRFIVIIARNFGL